MIRLVEVLTRCLTLAFKVHLVDEVIFLDRHLDQLVEVGRLRLLPEDCNANFWFQPGIELGYEGLIVLA